MKLTRGHCEEEQLWRSANGVVVLVLRPSLSPLCLRSLDKQTLQKVTLLQTWVRRAKQRKRSARTVEFVTWCETKSVVGARVAVG